MLSAFVSTRRNKAKRSSPSAPRTSASALSVNTTMAGSHTSPRNGLRRHIRGVGLHHELHLRHARRSIADSVAVVEGERAAERDRATRLDPRF